MGSPPCILCGQWILQVDSTDKFVHLLKSRPHNPAAMRGLSSSVPENHLTNQRDKEKWKRQPTR